MEKSTIIAISTRNRPDDLELCLMHWGEFCPNIRVIIVDDASEPSYCDSDYRFSERVGIPRVKNKCIELCMLSGAEHIFLVDDDCYPIKHGGLERYIESGFKHMCYTFYDRGKKTKNGFVKHNVGNGCMMYFHRIIFETIGGFDTRFGLGKHEHNQMSHRCYYNGLIPHPYIDFYGSSEYFYCLDQEPGHIRSFSEEENLRLIKSGKKKYDNTFASKEFISYI